MPSSHFHALLALAVVLSLMLGCKEKLSKTKEQQVTPAETLFSLLPSGRTGINFRNALTESTPGNILTYQYFYNGGGVAVGAINNDEQPEIYTLDMLPEDSRRQKLLFTPDNYERFDLFRRVGFDYQYMRHMLQINYGDGTLSEAGQLASLFNTDWNWTPLFADYDGWKDLFVTNGFLCDFINLGFIKYRSAFMQRVNGQVGPQDIKTVLENIPSFKVSDYIFRNQGDVRSILSLNNTLLFGVNQQSVKAYKIIK